MRIGTWNLAGRWSARHLAFMRDAGCDAWLLTEVPVRLDLGDGHLVRSAKMDAAGLKSWAAVWSRAPLAGRSSPHPAAAVADLAHGVRLCSCVLPWRGSRPRWPDDGATVAEMTEAALRRLSPVLAEGAGALVWGGDWNHALAGPERVGSMAGRGAILRLVARLDLDVVTSDCPHRIEGLRSIDHIAVPRAWRAGAARRRSAVVRGRALSDHDAYIVAAAPRPPREPALDRTRSRVPGPQPGPRRSAHSLPRPPGESPIPRRRPDGRTPMRPSPAPPPPGAVPAALTLVNWNLEWAPRSRREPIARRLERLAPDVLCATEADREILPHGGHVAESGPDYGYGHQPARRKVLLWSRWPLDEIDAVGDPGLPPGRFVAATCGTPYGPLRLVAVCVPWSHARVRRGGRAVWQDHLEYLERLGPILASRDHDAPLVVVGDFNQRIPRRRTPIAAAEALRRALGDLVVATAGELPGIERQVIDHVAHSPGLRVAGVEGIDRHDADGRRLSDHDAVMLRVVV